MIVDESEASVSDSTLELFNTVLFESLSVTSCPLVPLPSSHLDLP